MKSTIIFAFITLSALAVSATVLEKIFVHDRGGQQQLRKSGRFEDTDEFEYIKRAIEDFKENLPKYTGFYFLDFIFEVIKHACIFFLSILAPPPALEHNQASFSQLIKDSKSNNLGIIENTV